MTQWHYVAGSTKVGPIDSRDIAGLISSGNLSRSTPVWRQGFPNWMRLDATELGRYLAGTPPTITGFRPDAAAAPRVDVNIGGLDKGVRVDSNVDLTVGTKGNVLAFIALALAVLGFLTGVSFIPALICGHIALAQHKKDPKIGGHGMALSAVIISYVFIGMALLAGVGFLLFLLMTAVAGSLDSAALVGSTSQSLVEAAFLLHW